MHKCVCRLHSVFFFFFTTRNKKNSDNIIDQWRLIFLPRHLNVKCENETCIRHVIYILACIHDDASVRPKRRLHVRCRICCRLEFKVFRLRLLEAQYFWSLHQSHQDDSDKLSIIDIYTTLTYRQVVKKTHSFCSEYCWAQ